MIYLDLFLGFLKVGCFTFGGAYGAIPLIRDVVSAYGWLSEEELTHMIAISESTPGPIMVNMATYVGSSQGGLFGAFLATLAVVLPSFLIILLVTSILKNSWKKPVVQALLKGLKPCIVGIILATGLDMVIRHCIWNIMPIGTHLPFTVELDSAAMIITGILAAILVIWKRWKKKPLSPLVLIGLSALLGILIY